MQPYNLNTVRNHAWIARFDYINWLYFLRWINTWEESRHTDVRKKTATSGTESPTRSFVHFLLFICSLFFCSFVHCFKIFCSFSYRRVSARVSQERILTSWDIVPDHMLLNVCTIICCLCIVFFAARYLVITSLSHNSIILYPENF